MYYLWPYHLPLSLSLSLPLRFSIGFCLKELVLAHFARNPFFLSTTGLCRRGMRRKSKERTFPLRNKPESWSKETESQCQRSRRCASFLLAGRARRLSRRFVFRDKPISSCFFFEQREKTRKRRRTMNTNEFEKIKPLVLQFLSLIVFYTKRKREKRRHGKSEIKVLLDEAGNETNYIHTYIRKSYMSRVQKP